MLVSALLHIPDKLSCFLKPASRYEGGSAFGLSFPLCDEGIGVVSRTRGGSIPGKYPTSESKQDGMPYDPFRHGTRLPELLHIPRSMSYDDFPCRPWRSLRRKIECGLSILNFSTRICTSTGHHMLRKGRLNRAQVTKPTVGRSELSIDVSIGAQVRTQIR